MKAFQLKLDLFQSQFENSELIHFRMCKKFTTSEQHREKCKKYAEDIQRLRLEMERRFQKKYEETTDFKLFIDPFTVAIKDVAPEFQLELIKITYYRGFPNSRIKIECYILYAIRNRVCS